MFTSRNALLITLAAFSVRTPTSFPGIGNLRNFFMGTTHLRLRGTRSGRKRDIMPSALYFDRNCKGVQRQKLTLSDTLINWTRHAQKWVCTIGVSLHSKWLSIGHTQSKPSFAHNFRITAPIRTKLRHIFLWGLFVYFELFAVQTEWKQSFTGSFLKLIIWIFH